MGTRGRSFCGGGFWGCWGIAVATLFANGQAYPAPAELAERLCAERTLDAGRKPSAAERALLLTLVNDGHLVIQKGRRR